MNTQIFKYFTKKFQAQRKGRLLLKAPIYQKVDFTINVLLYFTYHISTNILPMILYPSPIVFFYFIINIFVVVSQHFKCLPGLNVAHSPYLTLCLILLES